MRGDAPRLVFIDALRGIAALLVVLYHAYSKNLLPMTGYEFPEPLHSVFKHGNVGVYVFFVISGFVIAHSIRGERVTARFVGWFMVRRSVRLDPPYWVTIAAMIVLTYLSNHAQHDRSLPMPTSGAVIAHVFYVQAFFGYPQIVGVFWTLCYEIQFYLVLVISSGIGQRLGGSQLARWAVFAPLWVLSLLCVSQQIDLTPAIFLHGWPYFFLGVIAHRLYNREDEPAVFIVVAGSSLVLLPFAPLEVSVALATAVAILVAARRQALASWTLGRAVQYLGRISYSLYLVHMLVGTPLVRYGLRHLGGRPDFVHATALVALALAVSIAAAHVMYVVVERPAMRLGHRLRAARTSPR